MATRRQLLLGGASVAGAAALSPLIGTGDGAAAAGARAATVHPDLPAPGASGIDHIVVLCMENRSFDHILGWLPGANGRQAGLAYPDKTGALRPTYHLSTFQGCGHPDPDHSYNGARAEYHNGACDGWLQVNDEFSIGYYRQADLPFLGHAAPAWTACDNYYAATLGPTFPNRIYLHSAQTDRLDDSVSPTSLPTIWDRLGAAGVTRRYYYNDLPFLSLWGLKYVGISHTYSTFLSDAASGNLPAVSYVDPPLFLESVDGLARDDHPHGDIRNGEATMNGVYRAVTRSPAWPRTVLVITFDEWGGFFDHVAPTVAPDVNPAVTGLRGFRVPALVVSPFAQRGAVAHALYDHTSILRMIEWRFGLAPLTPRDAAARNLAEVLDFGAPNVSAPQWTVNSVFALPCFLQGTNPLGNSGTQGMSALRRRAAAQGWPGQ
ncbi:MAG: alkaline phosphatase family protein [Actinobacteria bacterium]|nr:MAG: alkaline phosphatase family protein [Actinomycetota bacterium]